MAFPQYQRETCVDYMECATLPNSVCDTIVTQTCVCVTSQGFKSNANNDGCDYDCGALSRPNNGVVTYTSTKQDSIATYSCHVGFQIDGVKARTCSAVTPKGWSDAAPSCIAGKLGDMCNVVTDLCDNILNDIDECASAPCVNGASCSDGINSYTCNCVPGYTGLNCQIGGKTSNYDVIGPEQQRVYPRYQSAYAIAMETGYRKCQLDVFSGMALCAYGAQDLEKAVDINEKVLTFFKEQESKVQVH
ncbi:FBP3-like protein [Mya arenaria]|uniref:FBP3-like protein n=1 Tax=Mya arenaria TaxID=6604 RepID=A0ABY7EJF7_MYAAR|nr:FBP3-like protein [Mya arenaria]